MRLGKCDGNEASSCHKNLGNLKKNAWTVNWLSVEDDKPNLFICFSFFVNITGPQKLMKGYFQKKVCCGVSGKVKH